MLPLPITNETTQHTHLEGAICFPASCRCIKASFALSPPFDFLPHSTTTHHRRQHVPTPSNEQHHDGRLPSREDQHGHEPKGTLCLYVKYRMQILTSFTDTATAQMQAIFGPGCQLQASRGKFDVLQCKLGDTFVAHAIVYPQGSNGNSRHYPSWQCLLTGKSTEGVVNALENLWIQLQGEIGGPIKSEFGCTTYTLHVY